MWCDCCQHFSPSGDCFWMNVYQKTITWFENCQKPSHHMLVFSLPINLSLKGLHSEDLRLRPLLRGRRRDGRRAGSAPDTIYYICLYIYIYIYTYTHSYYLKLYWILLLYLSLYIYIYIYISLSLSIYIYTTIRRPVCRPDADTIHTTCYYS